MCLPSVKSNAFVERPEAASDWLIQRIILYLSTLNVIFHSNYNHCDVVAHRDSTLSREEALSVLRSSGDFVRYALSVAVQKIQQLEETGHTDGPDGQNADKTFRFLCDMTRSEAVASLTAICGWRPGFPFTPQHTFPSASV